MIQQHFTIEKALRNLEHHTEIQGKWEPLQHPLKKGLDGMIILNLNDQGYRFNAEIKRDLRQYQLDQIFERAQVHKPLIVIAHHISPLVKERLRKAGIAYLDSAGNVYLQQDKHFIWIEGHKISPGDKELPNRAFTKTGLKVVYLFLGFPDAINLPYREIANLANVSLGTITTVMAGLKDAGYLLPLNKKESRLQQKRKLFERWLTGYREILKPSLFLGTYQLRKNTNWRSLHIPDDAIWGGEPAAGILTNHLNPEIFTLYTAGTKNKLLKNLQLLPSAEGNVKIYQQFWNDRRNIPLSKTAPPLVTYADLVMTEDPRCIETAEIIYNKYLKEPFNEA